MCIRNTYKEVIYNTWCFLFALVRRVVHFLEVDRYRPLRNQYIGLIVFDVKLLDLSSNNLCGQLRMVLTKRLCSDQTFHCIWYGNQVFNLTNFQECIMRIHWFVICIPDEYCYFYILWIWSWWLRSCSDQSFKGLRLSLYALQLKHRILYAQKALEPVLWFVYYIFSPCDVTTELKNWWSLLQTAKTILHVSVHISVADWFI